MIIDTAYLKILFDSVCALILLLKLRVEVDSCAIFPFVGAGHAKLRITFQKPLFILHIPSHQWSDGFIVGAHAVPLVVHGSASGLLGLITAIIGALVGALGKEHDSLVVHQILFVLFWFWDHYILAYFVEILREF